MSAVQIKPKDQIAQLLNSRKGEIAKMLPKHLNIERLLKVAQIAATTTPSLAECNVSSLIGAIYQCAQMGLEPNTVLGHAYLVPFNTKRKDINGVERFVKMVQVIIGYKGLIDLARRSGQIISIAAHEVCENDKFELVYGLDEKLNHTPAIGERGNVIGFYAVAKLKDGGHCFEFMSLSQVEEIRANSKSAMKDEWQNGKKTGQKIPGDHPWWNNFVEMGRKTVIRRLAKYLPLSIEFQTAVALDSMAEAGKDQNLDTIDGEFNVVQDDVIFAIDADGNQDAEQQPAPRLLEMTQEAFDDGLAKWTALINSGKKTAQDIINIICTRSTLTNEQVQTLLAIQPEQTEQTEQQPAE